nr:hypothetical protein [Tanacetum cinerariifolium]
MKFVTEQKLNLTAKCLTNDVVDFYQTLKEEKVEDLKYFKSLKNEVESRQSQLELQQTQFSNKIDQLSKEYYYANHMNAILGVYNNIDEYSELACDYLEAVAKCERLEMSFQNKLKIGKKPIAVPIITREPKRSMNQYVATPRSRVIDLYSITLQETTSPNLIFLMAKASSFQAWLWHHRLSYLNFDTINLLSKNDIVNGLPQMKFFNDHLCSSSACFTQNRSLVIPQHEKTPYHIINGRKPSVIFFHIFGSLCYIVGDGENLNKMKEKGDACIFMGYSTQSKGYIVYNKRTRLIVETIHVNFDELPQMASDHDSSDPAPQYKTVTTSLQELEMLFGLMFDEYFNGVTPFVSKSSVVTTVDASNKLQQPNTTLSNSTTVAAYITQLDIQTKPEPTTQAPTVTTTEDINQAENAQVNEDEFINIFDTPVHEVGESSSLHVDPSNMHTFYQRHPSKYHWKKDNPLERVLRNPSQPVRTRRQLDTAGEMCMFALTVSQAKPNNIKEAMVDHAWIEAMEEELHQFERLDVLELVDKPCEKIVINIKWLWKNKHDEENTVICNKSCLVAKGYRQEEGIEFEESFAPIA